jgi:hypothetical protein
MRLHHTLRRSLLAALAALALAPVSVASPAGAAETVKAIVFPVDGPVTYTDTYGACRDGCARRHEGQDLMGKRMLPLLSAVTGTVHRLTFNNATGNSVVIKGADGWTYHYIHVNNDTPGTDDGKAARRYAFPDNIVLGAKVSRGQVVGYMGDSGNAESTSPHLHFEIRQPPAPGSYTGAPINPYQSLRQAVVWSTVSSWELRRTANAGPIDEAFSYGIMVGDRGLLCDWDGDGSDEAVIYRNGTWYGRSGTSSGGIATKFVFGTSTHTPLCGDVDGDGVDEAVVFRAGTWTIRDGFASAGGVAWTAGYGFTRGDKPVLGDWDGDGDEDFGIKRGEHWHVRDGASASGRTVATFRFGLNPVDLPVAGDWDGDGDDDAGIFRTGTWYTRSTAGTYGGITSTFGFGASSGQPLVGHGSDAVKPGVGTFRPRTA